MKPGLMFLTFAIIAIIIAGSFGLHLMPIEPLYDLSDSVAAKALYVCPAADAAFDGTAKFFQAGYRYFVMIFFGLLLVTIFSFGWNFYQNLLKDEFNQKSYNNSWFLLKVVFWSIVVGSILLHTPNYYKRVELKGVEGEFVLCENNTPGARPVHSESVSARR